MSDLISREALKEFINEVCFSKEWAKYRADKGTRGQIECILTYIENAPTVEAYTEEDIKQTIKENFDIGYEMAKSKYKRPQGEWIKFNSYYHKCDKCNRIVGFDYADPEHGNWFNYCPNCGADMRKGGAE